MGKLKIKLLPDGTIEMETKGIKGKKCLDYAKVLEQLADVKTEKIDKTDEYYQDSYLELDESQRLSDN
jgi:hypothetical protein